jgi:hypothetical protein
MRGKAPRMSRPSRPPLPPCRSDNPAQRVTSPPSIFGPGTHLASDWTRLPTLAGGCAGESARLVRSVSLLSPATVVAPNPFGGASAQGGAPGSLVVCVRGPTSGQASQPEWNSQKRRGGRRARARRPRVIAAWREGGLVRGRRAARAVGLRRASPSEREMRHGEK